MENIHDCTNNGECSRCGNCCGLFIPFTDGELKIIKKYVKDYNIQPQNRITDKGFEAHCCFYDKNSRKCTIYDVRPWVCKDFKCDHKDWLKRRDKYEKFGKYNSTLNKKRILATFDDMVYNNYEPILRYIFALCGEEHFDSLKLIDILKINNRLDLLDHIIGYDENNKPIDGKQMMEEYKRKRSIK